MHPVGRLRKHFFSRWALGTFSLSEFSCYDVLLATYSTLFHHFSKPLYL
jgi:hypothetical protein